MACEVSQGVGFCRELPVVHSIEFSTLELGVGETLSGLWGDLRIDTASVASYIPKVRMIYCESTVLRCSDRMFKSVFGVVCGASFALHQHRFQCGTFPLNRRCRQTRSLLLQDEKLQTVMSNNTRRGRSEPSWQRRRDNFRETSLRTPITSL